MTGDWLKSLVVGIDVFIIIFIITHTDATLEEMTLHIKPC